MTGEPVVIRQQAPDRFSAVVRTYSGVFDVMALDGMWCCSCGAKEDCRHIAQVQAWLAE